MRQYVTDAHWQTRKPAECPGGRAGRPARQRRDRRLQRKPLSMQTDGGRGAPTQFRIPLPKGVKRLARPPALAPSPAGGGRAPVGLTPPAGSTRYSASGSAKRSWRRGARGRRQPTRAQRAGRAECAAGIHAIIDTHRQRVHLPLRAAQPAERARSQDRQLCERGRGTARGPHRAEGIGVHPAPRRVVHQRQLRAEHGRPGGHDHAIAEGHVARGDAAQARVRDRLQPHALLRDVPHVRTCTGRTNSPTGAPLAQQLGHQHARLEAGLSRQHARSRASCNKWRLQRRARPRLSAAAGRAP